MICGDLHWKEIGKRVDVCTHITDAFCCTPEANTTLQSNYTPIKCNERKKTREQNTWEKLKRHQKFSGKGAHSENTERSKENV